VTWSFPFSWWGGSDRAGSLCRTASCGPAVFKSRAYPLSASRLCIRRQIRHFLDRRFPATAQVDSMGAYRSWSLTMGT
jgi:hypothetical protein